MCVCVGVCVCVWCVSVSVSVSVSVRARAHAAAIHGKYVYIESLGPGRMLSLCRVEVWGTEYDAWAEAGSNEDKWLYGAEPDWHHNGVEPQFFFFN